jgi:hypothetical protein
MNRELYLNYRTNNTSEPLYEYYKENYKESKPFLDIGTFFIGMQQWPFAPQAYQDVIEYYDNKFNIIIVRNKLGNIIKFI